MQSIGYSTVRERREKNLMLCSTLENLCCNDKKSTEKYINAGIYCNDYRKISLLRSILVCPISTASLSIYFQTYNNFFFCNSSIFNFCKHYHCILYFVLCQLLAFEMQKTNDNCFFAFQKQLFGFICVLFFLSS